MCFSLLRRALSKILARVNVIPLYKASLKSWCTLLHSYEFSLPLTLLVEIFLIVYTMLWVLSRWSSKRIQEYWSPPPQYWGKLVYLITMCLFHALFVLVSFERRSTLKLCFMGTYFILKALKHYDKSSTFFIYWMSWGLFT